MASVRGVGWIVPCAFGGVLTFGGPLVGLIYSALGIRRAFSVSGSPHVDPSEKARVLAEGISQSMNGAAIGIVAGLAGVVVVAVSLIGLFHANRGPGEPGAG